MKKVNTVNKGGRDGGMGDRDRQIRKTTCAVDMRACCAAPGNARHSLGTHMGPNLKERGSVWNRRDTAETNMIL